MTIDEVYEILIEQAKQQLAAKETNTEKADNLQTIIDNIKKRLKLS